MVSDRIDEMVQASIDRGPYKPIPDKCGNCRLNFHGLPKGACPGAFSLNIEAVQNQGVIDWTRL